MYLPDFLVSQNEIHTVAQIFEFDFDKLKLNSDNESKV